MRIVGKERDVGQWTECVVVCLLIGKLWIELAAIRKG